MCCLDFELDALSKKTKQIIQLCDGTRRKARETIHSLHGGPGGGSRSTGYSESYMYLLDYSLTSPVKYLRVKKTKYDASGKNHSLTIVSYTCHMHDFAKSTDSWLHRVLHWLWSHQPTFNNSFFWLVAVFILGDVLDVRRLKHVAVKCD